ncbi:MAG: hypothetical protein ABIP48_31610 [Planctomycetota bacterium]
MQLDKTPRIAVRERQFVDLLDLALCLIRAYPGPLLGALAAGIVPMMLLNRWLLADFVEWDFAFGFPAQYLFYMALLILLEAPLATAPATLYLGKAVFDERPKAGEIGREFLQSLAQLLIYQVLLRPWHVRWPYLNEVILLDRNPMRRKSPHGESTLNRSRVLHRGEGGDLFARGFAAAVVGGLLFTSIWLSILLVRAMLIGRWEQAFDTPMYTFYYPLAIWVVVAYFAVVRFLSYLDLRIRREGWEVELRIRAERARMERKWQ